MWTQVYLVFGHAFVFVVNLIFHFSSPHNFWNACTCTCKTSSKPYDNNLQSKIKFRIDLAWIQISNFMLTFKHVICPISTCNVPWKLLHATKITEKYRILHITIEVPLRFTEPCSHITQIISLSHHMLTAFSAHSYWRMTQIIQGHFRFSLLKISEQIYERKSANIAFASLI